MKRIEETLDGHNRFTGESKRENLKWRDNKTSDSPEGESALPNYLFHGGFQAFAWIERDGTCTAIYRDFIVDIKVTGHATKLLAKDHLECLIYVKFTE